MCQEDDWAVEISFPLTRTALGSYGLLRQFLVKINRSQPQVFIERRLVKRGSGKFDHLGLVQAILTIPKLA